MPDTNRRRSSRHLRLLVRATRQIPVSASPHLGHPEDWRWRQGRTDRQSPDLLTCYRETTSVHNRPVLFLLFRMYRLPACCKSLYFLIVVVLSRRNHGFKSRRGRIDFRSGSSRLRAKPAASSASDTVKTEATAGGKRLTQKRREDE